MDPDLRLQLIELLLQYRHDCSLEALQSFDALAARSLAEGRIAACELEALRREGGWDVPDPS
ncbi:hypothetical protein [Paludibacterium yongneupense]|uniref:hypothetical protein n=1 Tax=Paludibacterium yongneupense TaxID=400061 RepID=UPI00040AC454|nr:hypothetical protein [Paludibacterium yongneupense]